MDLLDDFSICGGPDSSHCLSPEQNDTSWISNDLRGFGSAFDSWVHLEEAARQPTSDASVYETPLAGSGIETGSTPGVEKRKDRDSSSAIKLSPNRGNKVAKDQSKTKTRTFACPFFKLDPTRHRACKKVKLSRVKDAKQHVHRRHMRSDPHDSCIYSDTEGVSEKQKDALSKYISRNKPIEEQWYDMWDIIFPGREHPQSVYLEDRDGFLEDTVPSLRSLWKQKRSEILSSISIETSSHIGVLDEGNLDKVVEAIFDRLGSGASAEDEDNLSANTARNPTYTETPRLIAPNTLVNQSPVDGDEVMRQDATTLLTPNSPLPIDENDLLGTGMKLSDTADIFADLLPTTFGGIVDNIYHIPSSNGSSFLDNMDISGLLDDITAAENVGTCPSCWTTFEYSSDLQSTSKGVTFSLGICPSCKVESFLVPKPSPIWATLSEAPLLPSRCSNLSLYSVSPQPSFILCLYKVDGAGG